MTPSLLQKERIHRAPNLASRDGVEILSLARYWHTQKGDRTQIWHQSTHSSYYILKCNELTKTKPPTCYQLHGQSFFFSEKESPWSSYILICFGHERTFHSCDISDTVTPISSSKIHPRICVLPSVSSPKATVMIPKFLWQFPQL
jgi:hypothetical protein